MKNIEFFDFFPGLSRSNEVYFGKDHILPKTLEKHVIQIKEYLENASEKDYKNVKWVSELTRIVDNMGNAVAKIINAERVVFCINPDDSYNACAMSIFCHNDLLSITKNKNGKTIEMDLDKIADLEDIIVSNDGYKYRNAKGKQSLFILNTGLFTNGEVDNIVAIILHELGHQFESGIFGVYKECADMSLSSLVDESINKVKTLNNVDNRFIKFLCKSPFFESIFKYIVVITFTPSLIPEFIRKPMDRLAFKLGFKKQLENPTYKMKDQLDKFDKGETKLNDPGFTSITNDIISLMGNGDKGTRESKINETRKEYSSRFKEYRKYPNSEESKISNWLFNFFSSIFDNLKYFKLNVLNILSLSNYNASQYQKLSFIKKYEFFADIFATSYGYGPNLYRGLSADYYKNLENFYKNKKVGINRIPLFDAAFKSTFYKYLRNMSTNDEHGTQSERATNMYTALVKELETNTSLNNEQRKAIKADIEALKKADDTFYEQRKQHGIWYNLYNKLIDDRIKGIDHRTEEEILQPIIEACQKSLNEESSKK